MRLYRPFLTAVSALGFLACADTQAAIQKCQVDLGVSWAPNACVNAVQDKGNQSMVSALGNEACERARLGASNPVLGNAACESIRLKAEKAAWIELEKSAAAGSQATLDLDVLVPGLPKPPEQRMVNSGPRAISATAVQPSRPIPAPATLPPQQAAAASVAGNTAALPRAVDVAPPVVPESPSTTDATLGSISYLDARDGFRDMKFGDSPKSGMTLSENDGALKFYKRSSDDLAVGAGHLSQIAYGFYNGRLMSVQLATRGLIDSKALLATLEAAYGQGDHQNEYLEECFWLGNIVRVVYSQKPISNDATAELMSVAIFTEKMNDEKNAADRSGGNL